jgi:hypothetical protein
MSCSPVTISLPRHCISDAEAVVGKNLSPERCFTFCGSPTAPCNVAMASPASFAVTCQSNCAVGRRPAGLDDPGACASGDMGRYFAEIAHLESASVTAFRILRDELRAVGAPRKLVRAAARAARDEIRHARSTSALARRFGGTPRRPCIAPPPVRSLEAIALENAVEGCVRETFGALLATRQAERASDPTIRASMRRIARDETQHAALSWQVARFLDTKLSAQARRNVVEARRDAARELLRSLATEPELAFAERAGLPSAAEAVQLAMELNRALGTA